MGAGGVCAVQGGCRAPRGYTLAPACLTGRLCGCPIVYGFRGHEPTAIRFLCQTLAVSPEKPPVVLLHGLSNSGKIWQEVVPLLSDHCAVYTPTALGHRGGPPVRLRPVTIDDVIDAAEGYLDDHGLKRPHIAGNSMGGFIAIELARRGRAATVCGFSPPGFWSAGDGLQAKVANNFKRKVAISRLTRPIAPLTLKSATLRRLAMRYVACHGDRLTASQALELTDDSLNCSVIDDLSAAEWETAPLDPLPCPITIAWSEKDAMLPLAVYSNNVRERLPQATFEILPGVGHLSMVDDPGLVARTILAATGVGV